MFRIDTLFDNQIKNFSAKPLGIVKMKKKASTAKGSKASCSPSTPFSYVYSFVNDIPELHALTPAMFLLSIIQV